MGPIQDGEDRNCIKVQRHQNTGHSHRKSACKHTLGTGIRQLELADEINEIVGALVGKLAQTVLTEGLSSFGGGGSNYGSLRTTQAPQLQVSCYPNKPTAVVGEVITWFAFVSGGSGTTSYLWSGDGVSGITTDRVLVGTKRLAERLRQCGSQEGAELLPNLFFGCRC